MKATDKDGKAPIKVIIENSQDKMPVEGNLLKLLEDTVRLCLEMEVLNTGCEISITLVDDKRINVINKEFRQVDSPTDVLSFPMVDMEEGHIISEEGDYDMDENLLLLGDIVISLEKAENQAWEYRHSYERELAFLTSHGVFHLLGYDHEDKEQENRMFGKQEEVLAKMGLTRG